MQIKIKKQFFSSKVKRASAMRSKYLLKAVKRDRQSICLSKKLMINLLLPLLGSKQRLVKKVISLFSQTTTQLASQMQLGIAQSISTGYEDSEQSIKNKITTLLAMLASIVALPTQRAL